MITEAHEYRSEFVRRFVVQGRAEGAAQGRAEGAAQGRAEGTAAAVLAFLSARGIAVPDEARTRISACTDQGQLDLWVRRAVTAETVHDLFRRAPVKNGRHGHAQSAIVRLLGELADELSLAGCGPVNIGTEQDYRIPGAALLPADADLDRVFLPRAVVVAEVRSDNDETCETFELYHAHGVEEIIVATPSTMRVELWARTPLGPPFFEQTDDSRFLRSNDRLRLAQYLGWPDAWEPA